MILVVHVVIILVRIDGFCFFGIGFAEIAVMDDLEEIFLGAVGDVVIDAVGAVPTIGVHTGFEILVIGVFGEEVAIAVGRVDVGEAAFIGVKRSVYIIDFDR